MRAGNLMWFLGAGSSAAAGIPTASDMVWEFKQQLYVSQRRVAPAMVADLTNPAVRSAIQGFIDAQERYPQPNAPDEYATLFEAAYPSEADRRTYIAGKVTGAKPSYGHIVLAVLMKAGHTRLVWSTNFDALVADACAKVYDGTGYLTTVALDAPALGREVLTEGRWPAEIKLHGDFRSRQLKNTNDELRQQDASLRESLEQACGRAGLVVSGYSGRDDSIMDALEAAMAQPTPFPGGLFWLHHGENPPLPRVVRLLEKASAKGVDGGLVAIENFDEALRDLVRLTPSVDMKALDEFGKARPVWSSVPKPAGRADFPVIRLNAIELERTPTVCRRLTCKIGGYAEVSAAIKTAGVPIIATRARGGVLGFGTDADMRAAFGAYGIEDFDLHAIEVRRLRYDSHERGLLREAISAALARTHGLSIQRRRSADLLAPANPADVRWKPLKELVGTLQGVVPGHPEMTWSEGFGARLDWANDRLWLLIEPRTVLLGVTEASRAAATDFSRERTVKRYNRVLNDLVSFWSGLLSNAGEELRALDANAGVDAVFRLGSDTAFSRRAR